MRGNQRPGRSPFRLAPTSDAPDLADSHFASHPPPTPRYLASSALTRGRGPVLADPHFGSHPRPTPRYLASSALTRGRGLVLADPHFGSHPRPTPRYLASSALTRGRGPGPHRPSFRFPPTPDATGVADPSPGSRSDPGNTWERAPRKKRHAEGVPHTRLRFGTPSACGEVWRWAIQGRRLRLCPWLR